MTGLPPFFSNSSSIADLQNQMNKPLSFPSYLSSSFKTLFQDLLLIKDPTKRAQTWAQIQSHEWFADRPSTCPYVLPQRSEADTNQIDVCFTSEQATDPADPSFNQPNFSGFTFTANSSPSPPPVENPKSKSKPTLRPLDEFILLQKVNGSFVLDSKFAETIKVPLNQLIQALPTFLSKDAQTSYWATALAIQYLHRKFSQSKGEWELLAKKSNKFIAKQFPSNEVEKLLKEASKFLDKAL